MVTGMVTIIFLVFVAHLLFVSGEALWGQVAGNAQHTGFSTQTLANTTVPPAPLWSLTGSMILSACVVDDGGDYLCLAALHQTSVLVTRISSHGKSIWQHDLIKDLQDCGLAPSLALDSISGTLYLWTGVCVIGYDSTNGNFLWRVEDVVAGETTIFMTVNELLHEGYVFGDGSLVCVTGTGNVKWNVTIFEPQNENATMGSPPSISQDGASLFLHYPGGLIKLNATDGTTIWNITLKDANTNSLTFDSPLVDVVRNYVITLAPTGSVSSNLYIVDQTSGKVLAVWPIPEVFDWRTVNPTTAYQPMVLFDSGILVVNINELYLYSYDLNTFTLMNVMHNGNLSTYTVFVSMAGTQDGILYIVELELAPDSKPSRLCALDSETLFYKYCTFLGYHMTLFYPLLVGQSSLLVQYAKNGYNLAVYN